MFVPLHVHSNEGSIGDSILKIDEYIKKAKEYGLDAVSITDHGSLASVYKFYHSCRKNNIKPIIGCEVYEVTDRLLKNNKEYYHLVLLAKNNIGFKNLLEICNDAYLNGFYYKPRTDLNFIQKHSEGLIALSGCVAGRIPQLILQEEDIDLYVDQYLSVFDDFYLELQPGNFPEQALVNQQLIELAFRKDIPFVVTNDIHYLTRDDHFIHDAHVKISRKMTLEDEPVYPDTCYWFMDEDALRECLDLPDNIIDEAVGNTLKIARQCDITLSQDVRMPNFKVESGRSEEMELVNLCFDSLQKILPILKEPEVYIARLLRELDVISKKGFSGYFLIVHDFVKFARQNNIPVGPGRGSAGGSLVAFLLGITLADPIKYGLMFERFLSEHRTSIPDIDIDFCSLKRPEMFYYISKKYGNENCALVSTRNVRKARASVRDTARILNLSQDIADRVAKSIPASYYDEDGDKTSDLTITESQQFIPEVREYGIRYPRLFEIASKLENNPSSASIHAAGMIISSQRLGDYLPLVNSKYEGIQATSLNLEDAELAGAVKFDFLALATISVIENTQKDTGFYFNYLTNDFNDPNVWNLIGSSNTTGLFQIGTPIYKPRMPILRPRSILELANCLALIRGPCISSGMDKEYMDIRNNKKKPKYMHEIYYNITKETNGIIIYQEQIMELAIAVGFSKEEGYDLLKAVSKKKLEKIASFKERFYQKAADKDIKTNVIDQMWEIIILAGLYSFNKSHAVCYALLCYASAYLKFYYPLSYMKNMINNIYSRKKKDDLIEAVKDFRRLNIKFLPLNINKSNWEFTLEGDRIRIGMCAVKSLGQVATQEIMKKRPFNSLEDFLTRITKSKCNKRAIISGIFAGLFKHFTDDRYLLYNMYMKAIQEEAKDTITLQSKEKFSVHADHHRLNCIMFGANLPIGEEEEILIL